MEQIRIHGRGGQGSVTLAHLIAEAAFDQGDWAQAFPAFGVERRGAPVEAFARIDADRITDRSQVTEPTAVVVQDPTLLQFVDVTGGLVGSGHAVVNSARPAGELDLATDADVVTIDAEAIGREHLGRPITNTSLLGAFAGVTGLLEIGSVETAITDTFADELGAQNAKAATAAYRTVTAVPEAIP